MRLKAVTRITKAYTTSSLRGLKTLSIVQAVCAYTQKKYHI